MKKCVLFAASCVVFAAASICLADSPRTYVDFDPDWLFTKGDFGRAVQPAYDDSAWRKLDVPHDWSAEGPFEQSYGSAIGFAPGGIAWYRKHFTAPESWKGKTVIVEFDGVYCNSEVWINGQFLGRRPYGYSSFEYDLTPFLKFASNVKKVTEEKKSNDDENSDEGKKVEPKFDGDPADNVISVRVDHSRLPDSRWYTGSGIYRHVRVRVVNSVRFPTGGVFVTTPDVNGDAATIHIETTAENSTADKKSYLLQSEIVTPDGKTIALRALGGSVTPKSRHAITQDVKIAKPALWSPDSPALYKLKTKLIVANEAVDEVVTTFGVRSLRFDADKGFFLNGKSMKLKGVCLHHDAGSIGAAVPIGVWERRLRILKDMGVNAVRMSHNPPAPELLDLCDRMGFLVKDEIFDEFGFGKNKWAAGWNSDLPSRFGYSEDFAIWSERDAHDMIVRDRNHPSIIMWSIGNEIDYANDPYSNPVLGKEYKPENPSAEYLVKFGKPLVEAVKKLDKSRPVTAALANVPMSDAVGFADILDVVGYNYQEPRYAEDHKKYPKRFIFGSETGHGYQQWLAVRDNEYISGQFLWTGIDYLGEASKFPNRASSAGLLDLCGFKKQMGMFRETLWSEKPVIYATAMKGFPRRPGERGRGPWQAPGQAPGPGGTGPDQKPPKDGTSKEGDQKPSKESEPKPSKEGDLKTAEKKSPAEEAAKPSQDGTVKAADKKPPMPPRRRFRPPTENWNFEKGEDVTVFCSTNCEEARLTLNGKTIATRKASEGRDGMIFFSLPFEPGTLKVEGQKNGKTVCEYELKTAGAPKKVELIADKAEITADGQSVWHVEYRITDEKGVRIVDAKNEVTFVAEGPIRLLGIGNGDVADISDGKDAKHAAFEGRGLAIYQATKTPGKVTLRATSPGLEDTSVSLTVGEESGK